MGADSGHHYCTRVRQGGAPPPDDLCRKISSPATVALARVVLDTQPVVNQGTQFLVILGRPFLATTNAIIHCRGGGGGGSNDTIVW